MILTLLRLHWLVLKRDRMALLLVFVVPILFFSVFAWIYLEMAGAYGIPVVKVAVLDLDDSDLSRGIVSRLASHALLRVRTLKSHPTGRASTRDDAIQLLRTGRVAVAIVVPERFAARFQSLDEQRVAIEVLEDRADSVAAIVLASTLENLLAKEAVEMRLKAFAGAIAAYPGQPPGLRELSPGGDRGGAGKQSALGEVSGAPAVPIERKDVFGAVSGSSKRAAIAFSAAGTGVLFLLFAMAGAGGTLLDEEQEGTLERLLNANVGIGTLLLCKWCFASFVGIAQVALMFVWGWLLFDLDLFRPVHLAGFVVVTVISAAAASALGIGLASACRSRAQFSGVSTILILVMSALGGSMFPRYLMPERLREIGSLTFNAWALDGYQKVFWYETSIVGLWRELLVLVLLTVIFLLAARVLAKRWVKV